MPVLESNTQNIDYLDEGQGPTVLLIHSASSSNRQWRLLIDSIKSRYRVLAINLFGYGQTSPWPIDRTQTLMDHVGLAQALMDEVPGPFNLIGHSLGGVVALEAALLNRDRVASLAMYEANPFHVLRENSRHGAYDIMVVMMDEVEGLYRQGRHEEAARHFMVFWSDEASWNKLSPERRARFTATIGASICEGRALQHNTSTLRDYASLTLPSLLMYARDTLPAIYEVQQALARACPHWQADVLEMGGHLAPLTHPERVNDRLAAFLDTYAR